MHSATLEETVMVLGGQCLQYPLSQYNYFNTSSEFPTIILQQLIASGRSAAKTDKLETHQGSALEVFFKTELGIPTTATNEILLSQGVETFGDCEQKKRHCNKNNYYGKGWDLKRPHCIWQGESCDFSSWINPNPGR